MRVLAARSINPYLFPGLLSASPSLTTGKHTSLFLFPHRAMASVKRKAEPLSAADLKKPKKDASLTSFFGAPKGTSTGTKNTSNGTSAPEPAPIRFDKENWLSTLTPEQKTLLKLEIDTLDPSWLAHLKDDITSPSFLELKRFLKREADAGKKVFPPPEDIYSWSRLTPLSTLKILILGQDPYHNTNQAHGLAFSVKPPTPPPPSLKNIFIALKNDYPSFTPPPNNTGLLTPWAEQGVLMLNAALTVRAHEANSHAGKGWETFTQRVVEVAVKQRSKGIVVMAWGSPAQRRCAAVKGLGATGGGRHLVLKSVHPSPLSAARGWFECGHFKTANAWLGERYGVEGEVNWDLGKERLKAVKDPLNEKEDDARKAEVMVGGANGVRDKEEAKKVDTNAGEKKTKAVEEFEGEDDEDAIEALEELARSSQVDANAAAEFKKAEDSDSEKTVS